MYARLRIAMIFFSRHFGLFLYQNHHRVRIYAIQLGRILKKKIVKKNCQLFSCIRFFTRAGCPPNSIIGPSYYYTTSCFPKFYFVLAIEDLTNQEAPSQPKNSTLRQLLSNNPADQTVELLKSPGKHDQLSARIELDQVHDHEKAGDASSDLNKISDVTPNQTVDTSCSEQGSTSSSLLSGLLLGQVKKKPSIQSDLKQCIPTEFQPTVEQNQINYSSYSSNQLVAQSNINQVHNLVPATQTSSTPLNDIMTSAGSNNVILSHRIHQTSHVDQAQKHLVSFNPTLIDESHSAAPKISSKTKNAFLDSIHMPSTRQVAVPPSSTSGAAQLRPSVNQVQNHVITGPSEIPANYNQNLAQPNQSTSSMPPNQVAGPGPMVGLHPRHGCQKNLFLQKQHAYILSNAYL